MNALQKLRDSFTSLGNEYRISERWWEHFDELFDELKGEQKLKQHGVMQAEGSDVSEGAAVGKERGAKGVSVGARCPRCKSTDLYDVDDHWTKCQDCKFSFVGG